MWQILDNTGASKGTTGVGWCVMDSDGNIKSAAGAAALPDGDYGDFAVTDGIASLDEDGVFDAVAPMIADSSTISWDRDSGNSEGRLIANVVNPSGINTYGAQQDFSKTFYEFAAIPPGIRSITIIVDRVSFGTDSEVMVQLGDSSGYYASTYAGTTSVFADTFATAASNTTGSFRGTSTGNTNSYSGLIELRLIDEVNHRWICQGTLFLSNKGQLDIFGGAITLTSGPLTKVKVGSANGTSLFDSGKINVQYS